MNSRHERPKLNCPTQAELDLMLGAGIDVLALTQPDPVMVAYGVVAADGRFDAHPCGWPWYAIEMLTVDDIVMWLPDSMMVTNWSGRAFALGEEIIDRTGTYSFDCNLNIFADPLEWLRAKRDGIVILPSQWSLAFDRLRNVPRIAIAELLLPLYRRHMKPARLPELCVIPERRAAA